MQLRARSCSNTALASKLGSKLLQRSLRRYAAMATPGAAPAKPAPPASPAVAAAAAVWRARAWLPLPDAPAAEATHDTARPVRVVTYNMLAQSLVNRYALLRPACVSSRPS